MGNENTTMPSPKPDRKADSPSKAESPSSLTAFPYVRGSREARLRSHKVPLYK